MIGLDTNVIVRYVTQDDPAQAAKATALIESLSADSPGFVPTTVVIELVWVLKSCYKASRTMIARVLDKLLRSDELYVEDSEIMWQSLQRYQKEPLADFADCLIERSAHDAECDYTATFDRLAAAGAGMKLIG